MPYLEKQKQNENKQTNKKNKETDVIGKSILYIWKLRYRAINDINNLTKVIARI